MGKVIDIDTLLPYGENLAPLLRNSCISETDLKDLLERRGVYIGDAQKQLLIPLMCMSLLSPKEFEELQEKQKTKEDNIKSKTSSILCNDGVTIQQVLSKLALNTQDIDNSTANYEFKTPINITFNSGENGSIQVGYTIERNDLSKDWANSKNSFNGQIVIQREDDKIKFSSEFTSGETDDINSKIIKEVKKQLIAERLVDVNNTIDAITADKFDNKERFKFMLSLANDNDTGTLKFIDVENIELGPEKQSNLPTSLQWMGEEVKRMIMAGNSLENIGFLKDESNYDSLIVRTMDVKYKFDYYGGSGTCYIKYGFKNFLRKSAHSNEFEIEVCKIYPNKGCSDKSKRQFTRYIVDQFDAMKNTKYDEFLQSKSVNKN